MRSGEDADAGGEAVALVGLRRAHAAAGSLDAKNLPTNPHVLF